MRGNRDSYSNRSRNPTLDEVIAAGGVSRRGFLGGGMAMIALAGGIDSLLHALPVASQSGPLVGFAAVPISSADTVVVPPGYTARTLISWGEPVSDGPEFLSDAANSAAEQALQWGMHNDGVVYFPLRGSAEGLLVQNSEYTDDVLLFSDGTANWNAEKTAKSQNAHGVNIIQISKRRGGEWGVVRPSTYARRITAQTPIDIGGPAAGDDRLTTADDPTGRHVLGTLNNCAMGFTPWGTYLACEENFNGYFYRTAAGRSQMEVRYGIAPSGSGTRWHTTDARFNADSEDYRNEPNRFGWVTEIDPFDPASTPVKRTALGRLKHEGAWVQEAGDGRVVVYLGDDEQFEYIYRYVSTRPWRKARGDGVNPLDEGTLYVAKFHADGTGTWLPLEPGAPGLETWSLNDILINTRTAADSVGATPMDRPEWIDTFPEALTAIATLTNNSARGVAGTNPRTGQPNPGVDAANPRSPNTYGHVLRWYYANDFTEPTFGWDVFALAGNPAVPAHGSTINGDHYGSPSGLYVAPSGRLWIQTDVSANTIGTGNYAGFGNNQMVCADPTTRETRRFLVGPKACEITGVFVTPDERTMFVGIQHPGEPASGDTNPAAPEAVSSWPGGPGSGRPRSSCLVITKDDGGEIGS